MKTIYLDNASTTRTREEVINEMSKYFSEKYGNPSSFHFKGLEAKNALENSRKSIAKLINAKPNEIYFTGSGTESINLAMQGVVRANKDKGRHIITTNVEHHAVLETVKFLESRSFDITILKADEFGRVTSKQIEREIKAGTILVSVIFANNEIGTINNIQEIGKLCREKGIAFHTDACQAAEYLDINVEKLNVDLLTLNGSKIYGPKGVGMLYVKEGISIEPIIYGGGQENNLRSGTENIPAIVGFAKAFELATKEKTKESKRLIKLRDYIIKELLKISKTRLNGHPTQRMPNNVNISFMDVEGESILLYLDKYGICASTGSACSSKSLEPSHVLTGIGLAEEVAHGAIRFSLGKYNTMNDVRFTIKKMQEIIKILRSISPVKIEVENNEKY